MKKIEPKQVAGRAVGNRVSTPALKDVRSWGQGVVEGEQKQLGRLQEVKDWAVKARQEEHEVKKKEDAAELRREQIVGYAAMAILVLGLILLFACAGVTPR